MINNWKSKQKAVFCLSVSGVLVWAVSFVSQFQQEHYSDIVDNAIEENASVLCLVVIMAMWAV